MQDAEAEGSIHRYVTEAGGRKRRRRWPIMTYLLTFILKHILMQKEAALTSDFFLLTRFLLLIFNLNEQKLSSFTHITFTPEKLF